MSSRDITILLIEADPQTCDLIADQSLRPVGYRVEITGSISSGLDEIEKTIPNVIITSLNLPGLSGKDLIVALASRWITTPIIVMASKGQETDVLQALRLGAADYLLRPIRETEVINVVENALQKHHLKNELEKTTQQLEQLKADMLKQARDFWDIFSMSKLLTKAENMHAMYQQIIETVIQVGEAERAWILTLDPRQCKYILQACANTSETMHSMLNLPYEDEFSALAGISGLPITLHGEALNRFNNTDLLGAAMVVPIKHNNLPVGTITISRQAAVPFNNHQQAMLELVAEYTSLIQQTFQRFNLLKHSLVVEQQTCIYQQVETDLCHDILSETSLEMSSPLKMLIENVDSLFKQDEHKSTRDQAIALKNIREEAEMLTEITDTLAIHSDESRKRLENIDLNMVVQQVASRFQPFTTLDQISFRMELALETAIVKAYASQITRVVEGLVSNAIKCCPPRSEISIGIETSVDHYTVSVKNQLELGDVYLAEDIFAKKNRIIGYTGRRFGGIGISLPLIKEIITAYKGQIWAKNEAGSGFVVSFTLPRS